VAATQVKMMAMRDDDDDDDDDDDNNNKWSRKGIPERPWKAHFAND